MKNGQFAQRYNVNASTIRYYIEKALITPRRENGQYIFDELCKKQMERLMRYKKYKFTLEEIGVLSYYENATDLKDKAVVDEILRIFHEKESSIHAEIAELEGIIQQLRSEIGAYQEKADDSTNGRQEFLPIGALNILCCPACGKRLVLKDADIDETGIIRGALRCECGYHAEIADGIVLCKGSSEETPFKAFENIDSVLAITDDFSPAYRNLIDKAHLWMYQWIETNENNFYNVLAGPFAYNFILKHLEALPDNALYIIVDVSVKKIRKLQKYFCGSGKSILYIAGKLGEIPLKQESIDLYIDDFSSSNYIFTYNKNLFEHITPLMKKGKSLVGQFIDYSMAPKSLENFKKDHENLTPDLLKLSKMHEAFNREGLKIMEENNCGSTLGNKKDFARNVVGESVSVIAYYAKKDC